MREETLKIIIDKSILDKYSKYYFTYHPRAKKVPIEYPYHPSINTWMILKRMMMNALKERWKDFIVWLIQYLGYKDLNIEQCEMTFISYFPTKARHDVDNTVPKFILDGLVSSGFIVDDDSKHLQSLTLKCGYDKEYPRTEIFIYHIHYGRTE